jgi:hypothetical protein
MDIKNSLFLTGKRVQHGPEDIALEAQRIHGSLLHFTISAISQRCT